jgi:hypothetical protein
MDTSLWLLPALLLLIALAAPRYGVDSRDGYDWNRRFGPPEPPPPMASRRRSTPRADVAALARFVRRTLRRAVTNEKAEPAATDRG